MRWWCVRLRLLEIDLSLHGIERETWTGFTHTIQDVSTVASPVAELAAHSLRRRSVDLTENRDGSSLLSVDLLWVRLQKGVKFVAEKRQLPGFISLQCCKVGHTGDRIDLLISDQLLSPMVAAGQGVCANKGKFYTLR